MPHSKASAIVTAALAVGALCFLPLRGQQRATVTKDNAARLAAALQKMRATSKELIRLRTEEYQMGRIDFDTFVTARRQLLEVELKLAETPQGRMKVLSEHLELAKRMEEMATARIRAGMVGQGELLEAHIARMRIEISILEEAK